MKTKLILLYLIFGIWQTTIGQEPDSLTPKTNLNNSFVDIDTTLVIDIDTVITVDYNKKILQQLDSLKLIYQEKKSELKILGELIDSLGLITNRLDTLNTNGTQQTMDQQTEEDLLEDWLIKDFPFQFTATDLYIYRDSLFIKIRLRNLKDQDINIMGRVIAEEGNSSKGLIPIVYRELIQSDDQDIIIKIRLDNNRLRITNSGVLQVFLNLRLVNNHQYTGNYAPFNKHEWDRMRRRIYTPYKVR